MANWCNARLVVIGQRPAVLEFSRSARTRPSSFFRPDMLQGEGQDLFAERIENLDRRAAQKIYKFQIRNDDGRNYFRNLSKHHKELRFILVFSDPNCDDFGSYLIDQGRCRKYSLPAKSKESVVAKHQFDYDSDDDSAYWEASWELMDIAQYHWQNVIKVSNLPE
jgi:hypothetical protein